MQEIRKNSKKMQRKSFSQYNRLFFKAAASKNNLVQSRSLAKVHVFKVHSILTSAFI